MLAQDSQDVFSLACLLEDHSIVLALTKEGDIRANSVGLRTAQTADSSAQIKGTSQPGQITHCALQRIRHCSSDSIPLEPPNSSSRAGNEAALRASQRLSA